MRLRGRVVKRWCFPAVAGCLVAGLWIGNPLYADSITVEWPTQLTVTSGGGAGVAGIVPMLPEEMDARHREVVATWDSEKSLTARDVVALYDLAGDFHIIQGLVGTVITEEQSLAIGQFRRTLHEETLKNLVRSRAFGDRIGVYHFGPEEPTAKTSFDFTLYPVSPAISGGELVAEYRRLFREVTASYGEAVSPEQMEIHPLRYETRKPDWRRDQAFAEFTLNVGKEDQAAGKFQATLETDQGDDGEYDDQLFTWVEINHQGVITSRTLHPSQVPQFFQHPDFATKFAEGESLKAWHQFNAYPDSLRLQGEALLASIDRGIGLSLGAAKGDDYARLSHHERERVVRSLYVSETLDAERAYLLKVVLDTAVNMVTMADQPEDEPEDGFAPLMELLRKEGQAGFALADEALLELARKAFAREGRRLLLLDTLKTASEKASVFWPGVEPDETVALFDREGNREELALDQDQADEIHRAIISELVTDLWLLDDQIITSLRTKNPALYQDLELLDRWTGKLQQLQTVTEALSDSEAAELRLKLSKEMNEIFHDMDERWGTDLSDTKDSLAKDSAVLRQWLLPAIESAVDDQIGGERLVPALQALEEENKEIESPLLSPEWLARINHVASFLDILKTYSEEKEINQEVLKASLIEGLGYLPGIESLYKVEGDRELTLTRPITGHGEIAIKLRVNEGIVVVEDDALFEPVTERSFEEPYLTSLLTPFLPGEEVEEDELREKVYAFFSELSMSAVRRDPTVWYSEREYPEGWQDREFYYLEKLAKQFVNQWLEGQGPFQSVEKPYNAIAFRDVAVDQLIQDYIVGKKRKIKEAIRQGERLRMELVEGIKTVAAQHLALEEFGTQLAPAKALAARLSLGAILKGMPEADPFLELVFTPRKKGVLTPSVTVRARVQASRKAFSGAWDIQWTLNTPRGDKIELDSRDSKNVDLVAGPINLQASAVDSQNRLIASAELSLDLAWQEEDAETKKKRVAGESVEEAQVIRNRLEGMATRALGITTQIDEVCGPAFQKVAEMDSAAEELSQKMQNLGFGLEALETRTEHVRELVPEGANLRNVVTQASKRIAQTREEIRQLSEAVCQHRLAIEEGGEVLERQHHFNALQEIIKELEKLASRMREDYKLTVNSAQRLESIWKIVAGLSDAFLNFKKEITDVSPRLWQMKRQMSALDGDLMDSRTKAAQVKELHRDGAEYMDHLTRALAPMATEVPLAQKILWEAQASYGSLRATTEKVDQCPNSLAQELAPVRQQVDTLSSKHDEIVGQGNVLRKALYDGGFQDHVKNAWEDVDATMTVLNLFRPRLQEQFRDAQKCAQEADAVARKLMTVVVPRVMDLSVREAKAQLEALHFKVQVVQGPEAKFEDQVSTVAQQLPAEGAKVDLGHPIRLTIYGDCASSPMVPDTIGLSADEARRLLAAADLETHLQAAGPPPLPEMANTVKMQHPVANVEAETGNTVAVSVYTTHGESFQMPPVRGMSVAEAKKMLGEADLLVDVVVGPEAPAPELAYHVIEQSPEEGADIHHGDEVHLTMFGPSRLFLTEGGVEAGGFIVCQLKAVHESIAKEKAVSRALDIEDKGRQFTVFITKEAVQDFPVDSFSPGARFVLPLQMQILRYPRNRVERLDATLKLEVVATYPNLRTLYNAYPANTEMAHLRKVHMTIDEELGTFDFAEAMPHWRIKGRGGPIRFTR